MSTIPIATSVARPATEAERVAADTLRALLPGYPAAAMLELFRAIRDSHVPGVNVIEDRVMETYRAEELAEASRTAVREFRDHQATRARQAARAATEDALVSAAAWLQTKTDKSLAECLELSVGIVTRYQKALSEAGVARLVSVEGR